MIKRRYVFALDGLVVVLLLLGGTVCRWLLDKLPDCIISRYGLLCPACGGTRCLHYLLQGKVLQSFWMNPYVFCTVFLGIGLLILLNVAAWSRKRSVMVLLRYTLNPRYLIAWAVGFAVFGIARNIFILLK